MSEIYGPRLASIDTGIDMLESGYRREVQVREDADDEHDERDEHHGALFGCSSSRADEMDVEVRRIRRLEALAEAYEQGSLPANSEELHETLQVDAQDAVARHNFRLASYIFNGLAIVAPPSTTERAAHMLLAAITYHAAGRVRRSEARLRHFVRLYGDLSREARRELTARVAVLVENDGLRARLEAVLDESRPPEGAAAFAALLPTLVATMTATAPPEPAPPDERCALLFRAIGASP